jgi:hypothetical protein
MSMLSSGYFVVQQQFCSVRAVAHQLRQDKHQDMRQKKTKADVSIMTQTGVLRFS